MSAFNSADGRALYRAVCAAPDDDLPRLVLADYLDEFGDDADRDRATFIRAQCEMERVPWMSKRWRQLDRAAETIRLARLDEWSAGLAGLGQYPRWRRGFVDSVLVQARRFTAKIGARLLDTEPVRTVRLISIHSLGGMAVREFVPHPLVRRLRGVDFRNSWLTAREFEDVAASGWGLPAGGPSELGVQRARDEAALEAGLPAVVRELAGLRTLRLLPAPAAGPRPSFAAALAAAAAAPAFARLEHLEVSGAGALTAESLARSPHLGGLRRLHLAGCG